MKLAPFLFLILSGCMAEPIVTMYGERFPPRAMTETVEVFQTNVPKREYIEIARIECGDTDDSYNMEQLLLKAKEIGADGIIIIIIGRSGAIGMAAPIGNLAVGVGQGYGMTAIAIKYK